ncbi:hypothetical protein Dda_9186 [Drechslerella dactyloides]|uniref:Uncharacterized protein n=1 Tax=Drechslerella dactyloides TaxID=74499 RepID=A0AAD6IPQ1_DREDA|nr:hypothetical protein Dda_9186 [Drechslerella dactyloides]
MALRIRISTRAMCISFVVAKPPAKKAAPKTAEAPPPAGPAEAAAAAAPAPAGFFFDTRTGRYFLQEQPKAANYTRLIEVAPPAAIPPMTIPTAVISQQPPVPPTAEQPRRRRKKKPKMLEGPAAEIRWAWAADGGEALNLTAPEGVGYATPNEAVAAAVTSGLDVGNKQVHVMPGQRGGYFVVGVSDS